MNSFWFTLGQTHTHRINGRTFDKDTVIEIDGDYGAARSRMVELCGETWSHQHGKGDLDLTLFPGGVHRVDDMKPRLYSASLARMTTDTFTSIVDRIHESSMSQAAAILHVAVENAVSKEAFNGDGGIISFVCHVLTTVRPMTVSDSTLFAYSADEERYLGSFKSREEAVAGAMLEGHTVFWIGQCVPPTSPESFWRADDWLEHVSCQDEYSGDWCEGWDSSTEKQRDELERFVRTVMSDWLCRHSLRPQFYSILSPVKHEVVNGQAVVDPSSQPQTPWPDTDNPAEEAGPQTI